ncbi:efflux RND transporter periplasmic adaptor subunit [Robertkochia sediminum]|uniref:efflux RND transporter periplasmic adaptor subunit n=1 Tax=Robertkochia sediminum TaxID=2785326 RepID=UPI001933A800|nr:HlyD family efflux transporter periplasmic adaptor subunit [Robertkochia sediminum]MBL7473017.1 HlyD family efflux transporter periplasmic adaptor subunit [Robertkochia sediminum]
MKYGVAFFLIILIIFSCKDQNEGILPRSGPITESVYATVTIKPDSLYQVYAAVAGILQENLVREGDAVAKGQPLFQIDNNTPLLQVENARLNLELARKNLQGKNNVLQELKNQIATAKLQYHNDSLNYFRQKNLWEQNIGSKNAYDQKKLAYEVSRNRLALLQQQYERTERELVTGLQQAENNYQTSRITKDEYTVSSVLHGTVYAVYKEPGELITQQTALGEVGSNKNFIIELMVDEKDIVKVQAGQQVVIALDAYQGQTFTATVYRILPEKNERNQSFMVEAQFVETPHKLYSGLAGEANIITAQKTQVLSIPRSYLVNDTTLRTEDGLITIQTGLQSLDRVEIISGIDPTTKVLKPGS